MHPTRLFATALAATLMLFASPGFAGARYFAPAQESASANLAADSNGGLHAAFTGYDKPTANVVYYRYCASTCEAESNWQQVSLDVTQPINVQIGLTPEGQPRLLITGFGPNSAGAGRMYTYGECNARCTAAAHWTHNPKDNNTNNTFSGLFEYKIPEHSFVVDDQGQPHFVYVDASYIRAPDRYGSYHLPCGA